jgi:hypothetical protein
LTTAAEIVAEARGLSREDALALVVANLAETAAVLPAPPSAPVPIVDIVEDDDEGGEG